MVESGMLIDGRYEIVDKIGSGGMAEVYKAKDLKLSRMVAIKILRQEFSGDKNFLDKFKTEAQSAASLSHANIVNVFDVGMSGSLKYIVMELVEGITLKKFIEKKGRLEVREAVGIAIQIAQGLQEAHEKNIVHRDIKPQNIIISRDGKVKVADFGIAKAISSNTFQSVAVGSVHYLSPEMARGGYCDDKSDIYSLGVTMYEMLTGVLPFEGDTTVSVAISHINSDPKNVRELVPSIPYSLDRIVQKCMQKKPENRYLHASDLIIDLKRSITNPEGNFVILPDADYVPSNPTRKFTSKEIEEIKSSANKPVQPHSDSLRRNSRKQVLKEEEEELDSVDSRWEKVVIVISIMVAVALLGFLIWLASQFIKKLGDTGLTDINVVSTTPGVNEERKDTPVPTPTPVLYVDMPNLFSYTFEGAEEVLHRLSSELIVVVEGEEYSDEPYNTVIKQYPAAGSSLFLGPTTIKLTLSSGPEPIEIPRLAGRTQETAVIMLNSMIEGKDIKVYTVYESSTEYPTGYVIRTEPAEGKNVLKGETIILVISNGAEVVYTETISLVGLTLDAAEAALAEKGLKVGNVDRVYTTDFPVGTVIAQEIPQGTQIEMGKGVNITISGGPQPSVTPTPTPLPSPTPGPSPTPDPFATPTPTPDPFADPTPTPTIEDIIGSDTIYFYINLETAGLANPIEPDSIADLYVELIQDGESTLLLDTDRDGYVNSEDFYRIFSYKLEAAKYPHLHPGDATVELWIYTTSQRYEKYYTWAIDLEGIFE